MKATIFGAISLLFLLFQEQLLSSSGEIAQKTGRSSRVSWGQEESGGWSVLNVKSLY